MPGLLTVDEFIDLTLSDLREPLKSDFISKISNVRYTVYGIDGGLEYDKDVLLRTKKLLKSVVSSGCGYAEKVFAFCNHLEKLGQNVLESTQPHNSDIASTFYKFSVVHRDLANMLKHLIQTMSNLLIFPIDIFMQGDIKSDFKKPFEKVLKDYEYKYEKLRKEKLQVMKDTGIFAPETFTAEMIRDLDEERRRVQLETCEYFIKVNELKFKRSTDLLQHLVDFYYSQHHYFRECLSVMEHFGKTMNDLVDRIRNVQQQHDNLKHRLVETREAVRSLFIKESLHSAPTGHGQPYVSRQNYGTKKVGYLLKKSEGKVKRVWQRRRVRIGDGELCLHHADESKPPVRLPLLTCQLKLLNETAAATVDGAPLAESHFGSTVDSSRNCFDLVSNCRTYNFQTEDNQEYEEWICILNNALREEFQRAMNFDGDQQQPKEQGSSSMPFSKLQHNNNTVDTGLNANSLGGEESLGGSENDVLESSSPATQSRDSRFSHVGSSGDAFSAELAAAATRTSQEAVNPSPSRSDIQSALVSRRFGDRNCADCNRPNPEWVSVNLGVLICLECCGVHRELGVHYSRTQSLTMDDLSIGQLLLPHYVGNRLFNRIFEASLSFGDPTLDENSSISQRRTFIKSKYVDRLYVAKSSTKSDGTARSISATKDDLRRNLLLAVKTSDLSALIQVYAENFDLMTPLQVGDFDEAEVISAQRLTGHTTALHIAIEQTASGPASDGVPQMLYGHGNLPLVEFIIQNSPLTHLQRTNALGETALHHAIRHARLDSLKMLLQAGGLPTPLLHISNAHGQTAYQLGLDLLSSSSSWRAPPPPLPGLTDCVNLLRLAVEASPVAASGNCSLSAAGQVFSSCHMDNYQQQQQALARGDLLRAVNSLSSVDWSLHAEAAVQAPPGLPTGLPTGPPAPCSNSRGTLDENNASVKRDTQSAWPLHISTCLSTAWDRPSSHTFSLAKSGIATLPRKKGFAPHPPSYSFKEERSRCSEEDHIDVLLDVLEEKPDASAAGLSPPPLPAKPPPELLSALFSTLPTRRTPPHPVKYMQEK